MPLSPLESAATDFFTQTSIYPILDFLRPYFGCPSSRRTQAQHLIRGRGQHECRRSRHPILGRDILAVYQTLDGPLQNRVPTASERIYREFLDGATEEERANLEGQLVAICIAACRHRHVSPPKEWPENGRGGWVGGPYSLPSWVRDWVGGQLSGEQPLEDGARHIGRRCVNALIDEIRWHERRKRGAQIRNRGRWEDDPEHIEFLRESIAQELADIGLPDGLRLEGDRSLLKRLIAAYPAKPSNVSIAREMGLSEAAVRKRRKRISEVCFGIADGRYQFCTALEQIGLKRGTKKWPYANNG